MSSLRAAFVFCCLAVSTLGFELAELGSGLAYARIAQAADLGDATLAARANQPLVLDLRYTAAADPAAAEGLRALLAARAAKVPFFVLLSPQTPAAFAEVLQRLPEGAVTLGVAGSVPAPGVVVAQTAETDRRAYDALSPEIPLAALLSGKFEKERFDEAALVKEFRNGNPNAAPPPAPDPTAFKTTEPAPVLTDRVLQRAVHLHRALLALKRR